MDLNKEQQSVVDSNSSRLLCLAGAGTGKTHVMLSCIDSIIGGGISPDSILALTFTNAAAREMLNRFKRNHKGLRSTPRFCTFHAFCYQLIASDIDVRSTLGYSRVPMICSDATLKRFYTEAEQATGISSKLLEVSNIGTKITLLDKKNHEILLRYIKKKLIENNFITFDIMCNDVCKIFETDNDISNRYHDMYKYIFVDEFQDTDENQWRFVESFNNSKIMVVGDTLQNLYSFRGTTNAIIKSLCTDDAWEIHRLTMNYRSDKTIVEYANNFSKYADSNYRVVMECCNAGGTVIDMHYNTFDEQNSYILNSIDKNVDTAILARTNKEVYHIQKMLTDHGIEFKNNHTTPNSIGIDLCKSIEDLDYAADWISSLLSKDNYNSYLRECLIIDDIKDRIRLIPKYADNNKSVLNIYHHFKYLYKMYSDNDIDKIIKYLVYDIHTSSRILSDCNTISDIIETLETNSDDSKSIYVGTVHSVKGLEFDNVIVTGVNSKSFTLDTEEQNNVFYVAVTRAKHKLTVLWKN